MRIMSKALLLACAALAPSMASAQTYPNRPVTIVVPSAAGASNDIFGRYVANGLGKRLGQSFVVENRPGAGSIIGTGYVAKAKPDGYTLLFFSASVALIPATNPNLPYDPLKDLKTVAMVGVGQLLAVTGSRVPLPTLAEVQKQAKAQKLFYGTSGGTSTSTFAAELFNEVAGVKIERVNYKGGNDALVDLAGGRIDLYMGTVTSALPFVNSKKATPVAVLSKTRSKALPDVPTIGEAGFAGGESDFWWGMWAPGATPQDIITRLHENITAVMATKEAEEFLQQNGAERATASPEEFAKIFAADVAKWMVVAKKHGIQAE